MDFKKIPTQTIVLCPESDNTMKSEGKVYVIVDDFLLVGLNFKADFSTQGDRDEYEDGYLFYEGSEWVEVHKVWGLEVFQVFNNEWGDELPVECYILTDEDGELIKDIIKDELIGIPPKIRYTKNYKG